MANGIRVITTFLVLSIFVAHPTLVSAQTFSDVTEDSWYFDYVEKIAAEGIVATDTKTYRPDDFTTRAELITMIMTAMNRLNESEMPASPTFSDVPVRASYYKDIETAFGQGIINGYTDSDGKPTGKFGPEDPLSRAAATKILINAFHIPLLTDVQLSFPDVTEEAWYHPYIATAYGQSIISGYENSYFGPDDSVTRAQAAKLIVNAQKTMNSLLEDQKESTEGQLEVSLSSVQPPPTTVPLASSLAILNLDIKSVGSDLHISGITLTRGGVGSVSDWYSIYFFEGFDKLTSEYTINSDSNKVTIPLDLNIKAGETKTLTAYGDTDIIAVPGNQHYFYLASASDINCDSGQVTGYFPQFGNVITIGSQYANTISINPSNALIQPERNEISEVATFKLRSGESGDVSFELIILTQGGSLSSDKIKNCSLLHNSNVMATADQFFNEQISFLLPTPYIVPSGQSRSFSVKCYIDGGRSTDTIQLYLDEGYDLLATDKNFGFPATPLNGYSQSLAPGINLRPVEIIIQKGIKK